jgi:tetratricopeptide (TPR) repeat protein
VVVKKVKLFSFLCVLFFLCVNTVGAQTQRNWWYTLEQGKQMYRQGNYGNALLAFEDARRQRRTMYERMERDFINLLSVREVRRMGDSLDWVERFIRDRRYADAAAALEELYYRIPRESFNNSASAALTAIGTLKDYPEAEYWIGEVYLTEGEPGLALSQFQKALSTGGSPANPLSGNPGFSTDLTYKIAGIYRIRREYNEMVRTLLSIVSSDSLWAAGENETVTDRVPATATDGQPAPEPAGAVQRASFARQAMTRTLENDGINRFLTLYRYANTEGEQAHRLLGYFYYDTGRHSRAQDHLMFAFLIQNTVIIDELISRRYDFTFTNLGTLAAEFAGNQLIADYIEKNEYYKTAYYLATSMYGNGKTATARSIWNFLAVQNSAGEWQTRSVSQLRAPRVEPALEMP